MAKLIDIVIVDDAKVKNGDGYSNRVYFKVESEKQIYYFVSNEFEFRKAFSIPKEEGSKYNGEVSLMASLPKKISIFYLSPKKYSKEEMEKESEYWGIKMRYTTAVKKSLFFVDRQAIEFYSREDRFSPWQFSSAENYGLIERIVGVDKPALEQYKKIYDFKERKVGMSKNNLLENISNYFCRELKLKAWEDDKGMNCRFADIDNPFTQKKEKKFIRL